MGKLLFVAKGLLCILLLITVSLMSMIVLYYWDEIVPPWMDKIFYDASSSTDSVKIAYLIMVHSLETVRGVDRILHRLYHPKHTFVIHLDLNADSRAQRLLKNISEKYDPTQTNIKIISTQKNHWGGISLIQTLLDLISTAIKTNRQWDFAINLSGKCYPIKTPQQIERRLSKYKGHNFLNTDGTDGFFFEPKLERVDLMFVETDDGVVTLSKYYYEQRFYPPKLIPSREYIRHGSQWVTLSREFCQFLITDIKAKHFLVFFSTTRFADEMYLQTIAWNTKFNETTFKRPRRDITMRFVWWGPYRSHPETLTVAHLPYMMSSNALFARKFNVYNTKLYKRIDNLLNIVEQQQWH